MEQGHTTREWLDWLTRVRLLMIALILSVGVAWPSYLPLAGSSPYFLPLMIFWITLALCTSSWCAGFPRRGGTAQFR